MKSKYTHTNHYLILLLIILLAFTTCEDNKNGTNQGYSISVDEEMYLEIGDSKRLIATIVPADGENIAHTWVSENPNVATVDETGLVTAHNIGKTKIVARLLANGITAECEVNVVSKIIHVKSIQLNHSKARLALGDEVQLSAKINPDNTTDKTVSWITENSEIATVDDNGLVKAIGIGQTVIKATVDNITANCEITVSDCTVIFSNVKYSTDASSITIQGEYESVGVEITELGVCWAQDKKPTIHDSNHKITATSPFKITINNLTPETAYYIRLYAKSNDREFYSSASQQTTLKKLITEFKLEQNLRDDYNKNYRLVISTPHVEGYESGISCCYGEAPNPEITDNMVNPEISDNLCIYRLKNLKASQTYYIRAYKLIDNKPIYFPGEANFATIGKDAKLEAIYTGEHRALKIWPYKITYTLPNANDIYSVKLESLYGAKMGKSPSDISHSNLNVKGGSGTLYVEMNHWSYHDELNGVVTMTLTNMTTGTAYCISFGYSNN